MLRALAVDASQLATRAQRLAALLTAAGVDATAVDSTAAVGGGGAPGVALPSAAVSLPDSYAAPLRISDQVRAGQQPAIAGRVTDGRLLLDLYAIDPADDDTLAAAVVAVAGRAD